MKRSQAWVELALKTSSCSQKELARRVGVSPTQISKWKNGEHMSLEMEDKFRAIVKIGDKHPEFVLWAGSLEDANKWDRLIHSWLRRPAKPPKPGTTRIHSWTNSLQGYCAYKSPIRSEAWGSNCRRLFHRS